MEVKGIVKSKRKMPSGKGWIIELEEMGPSDTAYSTFSKSVADKIIEGNEIEFEYSVSGQYRNISYIKEVKQEKKHAAKVLKKPVKNDIHLTEESIRSNALRNSVKTFEGSQYDEDTIIERAKRFEKYIRTGE